MSMMDKTKRNIVKTIIDGIKDAQMQLDYACDAKEAGNQPMMMAHLEEAKRRLSGVADWKKRMGDMPEHGRDTEMEAILWEQYDKWHDDISAKINSWK